MENDVVALGTVLDRFPYDNGPLTIFRREGERWRHEATLPDGGHPMDFDGGRIVTNSGRIYSQAAPGQWVMESELPAIDRGYGYADLDGDNLVVVERYDGPHHSYYNGYRGVLYRQDGGAWKRERVVYPATAIGYGGAWPSVAFNVGAQPAYADGEIYVRSHLPFEGEIIMGFSACRGDFNGDGVADFLDLVAFLEAREEYRMNVDYDMDGDIGFPGFWDEGDFLEFMRALEEGC